jgi:uncharacterized protein involved in exopolysaccharide biosynthesis
MTHPEPNPVERHRPADEEPRYREDEFGTAQRSEVRTDRPAPSRTGTGAVTPFTLVSAIKRYPLLVLLPIVAFVAVGATIGLRRAPIYTAATQVNVGSPDVTSQATPGYVQAAEALASAYSREVTSVFVYKPVAAKLHTTSAAISGRLSSSAVPNSPTFYVNATGSSAASAIALAGQATSALQAKINSLNANETASPQLLNRYKALQGQANDLFSQAGRLQHSTTPGSDTKARALKVKAQVAQLQAQTLAQQYTSLSTNGHGTFIQVLNPAATAASDRNSVTERYALVGLAAGLLMGLALAYLAGALRYRRELRRSLA